MEAAVVTAASQKNQLAKKWAIKIKRCTRAHFCASKLWTLFAMVAATKEANALDARVLFFQQFNKSNYLCIRLGKRSFECSEVQTLHSLNQNRLSKTLHL
jgi:hypothetical protein